MIPKIIAFATALALYHRQSTGRGQLASTSLVQAATYHQALFMFEFPGYRPTEPRGYFALGEYQQAIDVADQCLQRVVDPEFIANVYSNLGDAQTRLGAYGPGHRTYIMGYTRDYILNWRGVVSLVGE